MDREYYDEMIEKTVKVLVEMSDKYSNDSPERSALTHAMVAVISCDKNDFEIGTYVVGSYLQKLQEGALDEADKR